MYVCVMRGEVEITLSDTHPNSPDIHLQEAQQTAVEAVHRALYVPVGAGAGVTAIQQDPSLRTMVPSDTPIRHYA